MRMTKAIKIKKRCKTLWLAFAMLMATGTLHAQSVVVDASVDSMQILIGEQAKIKLEASFDAGKRAVFPFIQDTIVRGIEVVDVARPDTQYLNDRKRLHVTQEYTVTSFDSALYYIPPFEVKVDSQVYRSQSLALKVYSIPVDTLHPERFFGQKDIMEAPFAWSDWAPSIGLSLLAIALSVLFVFLIIRFNDNKPIIRKIKIEPKLPPHEQAMKEIERIKGEKIWQKGRSKEYYTELTDAIRVYIRDRFGFNALEMTSSEIINKLLESKDKEAIDDLKELFVTADLVKFAKYDPLMNENDMNLVTAIDFINETKLEVPAGTAPQPTEITVEEKRSKRAKIGLGIGAFVAGVAVVLILIYVGMNIYDLCF